MKLDMFNVGPGSRKPNLPDVSAPSGYNQEGGIHSGGRAGGRVDKRRKPNSKSNKGSGNRNKGKMTFETNLSIKNPWRNKPGDYDNSSTIGDSTSRRAFFDDTNSSPVNFATPFRSKGLINNFRNHEIGDNPIHLVMMDFILFNDIVTDTPCKSELNLIFRNYIRDVRRAVNSSAYNVVTLQNLRTYFKNICEAIFLYYEVDSLLSYRQKSSDLNRGLEVALSMAGNNTSLMENQFTLRRALRGLACPPQLFKFCQWIVQFYRSGSEMNSSVIKICFSKLWNTDQTYKPSFSNQTIMDTEYTTVINNLTSDLTNSIISPLLKAYPHWEITDLPLSDCEPVFDQNICDIFCNQRIYKEQNSYNTHWPSNDEDFRMIVYTRQPEEVDSIVESMLCFNDFVLGMITESIFNSGSSSAAKLNKAHVDVIDSSTIQIHPSISYGDAVQRGDTFNIRLLTETSTTAEYYNVVHEGKMPISTNSVHDVVINTKEVVRYLMTS